MGQKSVRACGNCRHYQPHPGDSDGKCLRFPPVLVPPVVVAESEHPIDPPEDGDDKADALVRAAAQSWAWAFPVVSCDEVCGEFKRLKKSREAEGE